MGELATITATNHVIMRPTNGNVRFISRKVNYLINANARSIGYDGIMFVLLNY